MNKQESFCIENNQLVAHWGEKLREHSVGKLIELDKEIHDKFYFQLNRINDLVVEFDGYMPPSRISHYVLAFITKGQGRKIIGQYSFEIEPNMLLIFPKNIIHSTNRWDLSSDGYMLSFNESLFSEIGFPPEFLGLGSLFRLSISPNKIVDELRASKIRQIFKQLFSFKNNQIIYWHKSLVLKLADLIFEYKNIFESQELQNDDKFALYDKFTQTVEENFRTQKSIKQYAEELFVHPNHLNAIVKKHLGKSAKQYVHERILLEADYLLKSTSLTIKEIAIELGFDDYSYFSRFYKTQTDSTPQQFRQKRL